MKKIVTRLATIALLGGAVSAFAIQPGPWTTFYTGLNGGYGWGEPSTSGLTLVSGVPTPAENPIPNTLYPSLGGGTFGGQFGFDWQFDQWIVAGLKYDMDWSGLTGSVSVSPYVAGGTGKVNNGVLSASESLTWFGDLLPRLGFLPINNLLIYATGGLAFGHVDLSESTTSSRSNVTYPGSLNTTLPGWAVGAGAEWLITPHWSLSGEYLYNELDNVTFIANRVPAYPPNAAQVTTVKNYQTTELAINYRF